MDTCAEGRGSGTFGELQSVHYDWSSAWDGETSVRGSTSGALRSLGFPLKAMQQGKDFT